LTHQMVMALHEAYAELAALEAESAAMREALDTVLGDAHELYEQNPCGGLMDIIGVCQSTRDNCDALTPDSGKVLVDVEKLREIEWCSHEFGDFCEVCDAEISEGHADDCWLAALLKDRKEEHDEDCD